MPRTSSAGNGPCCGEQVGQRRAAHEFGPQSGAPVVHGGAVDADDIGLAHAREPARFLEELVRQRIRIDLAQFQRDLQVEQRIVGAPDLALRAAAERLEHLQGAEAEAVRGRRLRRDRADLQMAKALRELLDFAQAAQRGHVGLRRRSRQFTGCSSAMRAATCSEPSLRLVLESSRLVSFGM